jgi:hypothetical protein
MHYSVTPRSDFQLRIDGFPHLLVEVESDPRYESDRIRMQIQAACTVRLAQSWVENKVSPVVLMALYVDKTLSVDRYLFCQPKSIEVSVSTLILVCWL